MTTHKTEDYKNSAVKYYSLFNDTANVVIKMALNLNNYINRSLRHK
jgi:hypothetical protein